MRLALFVASFTTVASTAAAEAWVIREGDCGELQSRWNIQQERSGVWIGTIDHHQIRSLVNGRRVVRCEAT